MKRPKLGLHEWGAVIIYVLTIAITVLYTQIYIPWKYPAIEEDPYWLLDPYIDVYITGSVKYPGQYKMKRGSTRGDLLTKSDPLQNADLQKLKTSVKLKQGDLIEIPEIQMVSLHIEGHVVKPLVLTVPKGTKVFELQDEIKCLEGADLSPLTKRRAVRDGETVLIKKKKS